MPLELVSGRDVHSGCHSLALTLLGQEACVQRQGLLRKLLSPQHPCLPGLPARLAVPACGFIDFPRVTPKGITHRSQPLLRATRRPTVLHFLWVVGAVWFAAVGGQG